jgi:hypothetical protein
MFTKLKLFTFLTLTFLLSSNITFAQPSIEISHTNINFDDVAVNYSGTQIITIKNNGTEDLEISDISIDGTGFTIYSSDNGGGTGMYSLSELNTPTTIPAYQEHYVAIRFSPTEARVHWLFNTDAQCW